MEIIKLKITGEGDVQITPMNGMCINVATTFYKKNREVIISIDDIPNFLLELTKHLPGNIECVMSEDVANVIKERCDTFAKDRACSFAEWIKGNRWNPMPNEYWFRINSDIPREAKSTDELYADYLIYLQSLNTKS